MKRKKDKEIERLNNIIDKAIEFMKTISFNDFEISQQYRVLLEILKGSDKE